MRTSMHLSRIAFAAVVAACSGLAGAAQQSFMLVDGIRGESVVKGHQDEIDIISYAQSVSRHQCGRAVVLKHIDLSSPALAAHAASGTHIRRVVITTEKEGKAPLEYFIATMQDVLIASIDISDDDTTIAERVTLHPRTLQIAYRRQNEDGSLGAAVTSTVNCF
jgi:type VI secretion system Hcp family effector